MEVIALSFVSGILLVGLGVSFYLIYNLNKKNKDLHLEVNKMGEFLNETTRNQENYLGSTSSDLQESLKDVLIELEKAKNEGRMDKANLSSSIAAFKEYFENKLNELDTEVKRVIRQY